MISNSNYVTRKKLKSNLQKSIESGSATITAEIMPPRGVNTSESVSVAKKLSGRVHAINVTDGSRAIMRMSSMAFSKILLESQIEPIMQLTCRDKNRISLQAEILGANALGIKNILCLTGDPVQAGDQQKAKAVHEYEAVKLLQQIQSFNDGKDPVFGKLSEGGTNIYSGAAADPNSSNYKSLFKRLERKKLAGAKFLQTQMIMNPSILEKFCKEIANPLELPVLAGIFLLKSAKNANYINKVVPGACIPNKILARLESSLNPLEEGMKIASEQAKQFSEISQGIHLMAIKAEKLIPQILNQANIPSIKSAN